MSGISDVSCGPKTLLRSAFQSVGRALAVLMLIALSAHMARAQKVSVEFDKAADFSKYHTFAIRDGELNSRNPALNGELTKKNIETDIEQALTAKGLMRVTGPSDLNVRFTLGSARRVEAEAYPAGWYTWAGDARCARYWFAEGTLVIDLRDPATHSLVWRGIATPMISRIRRSWAGR